MPVTEVALYALALAAYPGALTMFLVGALAEAGSTWALVPGRGGPLVALRSIGAAVLEAVPAFRLPLLATLAAFLALVAAIQVAIPFNPVPEADRNLLLAGLALVACAWVTACWGWEREEFDPAFMLLVNAAWLVALLAPSLETQNLRPQAVAAVTLPALAPVKIASGLLYLLSLPPLMQLIPEGAPQGVPGATRRRRESEEAGFALVRVLLWLPYCGLFASIFFPPASDDAQGIVRFLLLAAAAGAFALGFAANLIHRGAVFTRRRYGLLLTVLSALTIAVAIATAIIEQPNML